MTDQPALRVALVAGEESGDLLAADLVRALARKTGRRVELIGVGGRHLEELGLKSSFDASEIALMGFTAVLRDLPRLIHRISSIAALISREKPDCLVTVDSPDFALRVARKVKAVTPEIPVVHYVCPSVWAWRASRAPAMRAYVDHVLCLLPFEPEALQRLGGPPGAFVGHRLARDPQVVAAAARQIARPAFSRSGARKLLVLPGSRRGEVTRLLEPFGQAVETLHRRGNSFEISIPTVPKVASIVADATRDWPVVSRIIVEPEAKWDAIAEADSAIAASGTVLLEMALARVPVISCYKLDWISRIAMRSISLWSAALPNLVAGWPIIPEFYDQYLRPEYIARLTEQLWSDTPARAAQLHGFEQVTKALTTEMPSGEIAAEVVLGVIGSRQSAVRRKG